MSATDELRRMLDERVVEWWPLGKDMTETVIDDVRHKFRQVGRGILWSSYAEKTVPPEQAIAATLGRGECHEVMIDRFFRGCSECGYVWEYMYGIGKRVGPSYCPECGAKVVSA